MSVSGRRAKVQENIPVPVLDFWIPPPRLRPGVPQPLWSPWWAGSVVAVGNHWCRDKGGCRARVVVWMATSATYESRNTKARLSFCLPLTGVSSREGLTARIVNAKANTSGVTGTLGLLVRRNGFWSFSTRRLALALQVAAETWFLEGRRSAASIKIIGASGRDFFKDCRSIDKATTSRR